MFDILPSKQIHLVDENFNKLPNELMIFKLQKPILSPNTLI